MRTGWQAQAVRACVLAAVVLFAVQPLQASEVDLRGRTVRVLVNYSAGGPTDIFARLVVRHLARYVPGRPSLVVENMPGAGGLVGANYLYNAANPDGLTIGIFTAVAGRDLRGEQGVRYNPAGFGWLGATGETTVFLVNPRIARDVEELQSPRGRLVAGGLSPDGGVEMLVLRELLGLAFPIVWGYPGRADIAQAVQRGEVNFMQESVGGYYTSLRSLREEGVLVGIAQFGLLSPEGDIIRDSRVEELPTLAEIVRRQKPGALGSDLWHAHLIEAATRGVQRAMLAPPGTPEDRVAMWRRAVEATFMDSEFRSESRRLYGYELELIKGEGVGNVLMELSERARQYPGALAAIQRLVEREVR